VLLGVKWLLRALQDPQNGSRIGLRMAILGYLGPLKRVHFGPYLGTPVLVLMPIADVRRPAVCIVVSWTSGMTPIPIYGHMAIFPYVRFGLFCSFCVFYRFGPEIHCLTMSNMVLRMTHVHILQCHIVPLWLQRVQKGSKPLFPRRVLLRPFRANICDLAVLDLDRS